MLIRKGLGKHIYVFKVEESELELGCRPDYVHWAIKLAWRFF